MTLAAIAELATLARETLVSQRLGSGHGKLGDA
jgi:hypothetical protein